MRLLSILVMAFGSVLCVLSHSAPAAEEASSSEGAGPTGTSTSNRGSGPGGSRFSGKVTYQTSRASTGDTRSFRASSADDSGSMNENSTQPGLNYLRANLNYHPARAHSFSLGSSVSLDSKAKRLAASGRSGRTSDSGGSGRSSGGGDRGGLGQVFTLRYSYRMNQHYSFGVGDTYFASRFMDPTVSGNWRNQSIGDGYGQRAGLSLSVPTTMRSQTQHLITRATARSGLSYTKDRWVTSCGLAHSHPFYNGEGPTSDWLVQAQNATSTRRRGGSGGGSGGGRRGMIPNAAAAPADGSSGESMPPFEEVDMVLAEREVDRTTGSMGVTFSPSHRWKLGSGAGVTYVQTARQKAVWLTSARILGASYNFWKMEAGSDLQLFSDIHKYQHPSLPSLVSVGVHLSYAFGDQRPAI